jgi:hypothetical protein
MLYSLVYSKSTAVLVVTRMKLEGHLDQLMAIAAHQHCLGDKTLLVQSCAQWIQETWPQMNFYTQVVVARNTAEALLKGNDKWLPEERAQWAAIASWMWDHLKDENKELLQLQVWWKTGTQRYDPAIHAHDHVGAA